MLLEIFPALGRLIALRMRELGEEEATMMQMGVLMRLKAEPTTASELAKQRKVSLQSASVLVQTMVERGWLERYSDPNDRRRSLLQVTPRGLELANTTQGLILETIAGALSEFQPEELDAAEVFLPALRRVVLAHLAEPVLEK